MLNALTNEMEEWFLSRNRYAYETIDDDDGPCRRHLTFGIIKKQLQFARQIY